MYKDNTVGNVVHVAETGRDCGTTARLSNLSMPFQLCASPLKGEVQCSPEPSARPLAAANSEKRQNCLRAYSRTALDCKKKTILCFLPSWSTLLLERGVGGRGIDLRWQPAVKHHSPAAKATNSDSCDRAVAQVKKRIPEQGTASTEPISKKKGIKLIPKTIGNRKEIVREVVPGDKHNLRKSANCKAQISTMFGVDTHLYVAICKFSWVVFVTSNNFTQNLLFYFQYLYFRMLCLHINVFGLVFYTRQLVLCSEFWTLREKCTIMRSSSSDVACRNYKTMCVLCHRRPFF